MEVVVVFAGKSFGGGGKLEEVTGQPRRFRFGDRLGHARFRNHALNLSVKRARESTGAASRLQPQAKNRGSRWTLFLSVRDVTITFRRGTSALTLVR